MTPRKITMLSAARSDLAELQDYIALDNPLAAALLAEKITNQIDGLLTFPERYPLVSSRQLAKRGYRKLVVGNYLVFFCLTENEIIVHRILHGKRDYRWALKNG